MQTPGVLAKIGRYPPGLRQGWHRDRCSRVSVVLRGAFSEDGPAGGLDFAPGDVLLKSSDVRHQDAFGPDGALLLAVEIAESDSSLTRLGAGRWRRRNDAPALRLALSLLESVASRDERAADIAASDIVASSDGDDERRVAAPAWLLRLKDEIETSGLAHVDVSKRAREAGVHPAHLSRLFRRIVGVSITEHAQTHNVRRALEHLAGSDGPLCDVAVAAGFYDQSHMNRVFRRVCGRTPGALRALVKRVAPAFC
jgi:AraC family transcriptional regulator